MLHNKQHHMKVHLSIKIRNLLHIKETFDLKSISRVLLPATKGQVKSAIFMKESSKVTRQQCNVIRSTNMSSNFDISHKHVP